MSLTSTFAMLSAILSPPCCFSAAQLLPCLARDGPARHAVVRRLLACIASVSFWGVVVELCGFLFCLVIKKDIKIWTEKTQETCQKRLKRQETDGQEFTKGFFSRSQGELLAWNLNHQHLLLTDTLRRERSRRGGATSTNSWSVLHDLAHATWVSCGRF